MPRSFDRSSPRKATKESSFSRSARSLSAPFALQMWFARTCAFTTLLCLSALGLRAEQFSGLSFPFDPKNPLLIIPIDVEGRQCRFLLDTGASISVVDASLREFVGKELRTGNLTTVHGTGSVQSFAAPHMALAGRSIKVTEMCALNLSSIRDICGVEVHGILGMDFLRDLIVEVDFDRGRITFPDSVPAELGSKVRLLYSASGLRAVLVAIEGAGDRTFDIDTGDIGVSFGTIESRLLERLYAIGRAERVGSDLCTALGTDRMVRRNTACVSGIEVGGHRHSQVVLDESKDNHLGLGFLLRYRIVFDFPGRAMYLRPGKRYAEPNLHDLSGARLKWSRERATVASVDRGSNAERAGLTAGDVLMKMDGDDLRSTPMFEIRRRLCVRGTHSLQVLRGAESIAVTLELTEAEHER